ncbi:MAG: hypothetical protein KJ808_05190, partial [Acidobacteria bacterium]|nr:hypothetical protein [Acidobacteriota bacterium]MBU4308138.1 hypothetical protein [Acidobacteriota bacterium]
SRFYVNNKILDLIIAFYNLKCQDYSFSQDLFENNIISGGLLPYSIAKYLLSLHRQVEGRVI